MNHHKYDSYSQTTFSILEFHVKPLRIFTKKITMRDIIDYTKNENFKNLVIKASHGDYYGFNLKVKKERTYAMKIVNPVEQNNFMVVGWKVSKTLPKWIHNSNSWVVFIDEMGADEVEVVEPLKLTKWEENTKKRNRKMRKMMKK